MILFLFYVLNSKINCELEIINIYNVESIVELRMETKSRKSGSILMFNERSLKSKKIYSGHII